MPSAALFTFGSVALILTVNALRRPGRVPRRFAPLWLPGMVTSELAPLWLLTSVGIGGALVASDGLRLPMGRLGLWMLAASAVGLLVILGRTRLSIERIDRHVDGPVFRERLPTLLLGRPVAVPSHIEEVHGISYQDGLTLDVIRSKRRPGSPRPALVYVHGGGWTGGGPHKQARRMYHSLATAGWFVATVRYPLAPEASIPDQVEAIKRAIVHVKTAHPDVDPERVVLSGSSAGGHLAALTALAKPGEYQPGFEEADTTVAACIPMYGIYDMANRRNTRHRWPYVDRDVMKARYDEDPDLFHELSPVDRVHADAPPFLVVHGTHDSLVPIAEGELFAEDLRSTGAAVDFLPVLGAQHGFDAVSSPLSRRVAAAVTSWASRVVRHPIEATA